MEEEYNSEYWIALKQASLVKKQLKNKLELLGKKVILKGKEGILVVAKNLEEPHKPQYYIKTKKYLMEFLPEIFDIWCEKTNKYIELKETEKMFFDLTEDEIKYLKLDSVEDIEEF